MNYPTTVKRNWKHDIVQQNVSKIEKNINNLPTGEFLEYKRIKGKYSADELVVSLLKHYTKNQDARNFLSVTAGRFK